MRFIPTPEKITFYQAGMRTCNCEEYMDARIARWNCHEHGTREPNYPALDKRTTADLDWRDHQ
jgi:hypothetical protein